MMKKNGYLNFFSSILRQTVVLGAVFLMGIGIIGETTIAKAQTNQDPESITSISANETLAIIEENEKTDEILDGEINTEFEIATATAEATISASTSESAKLAIQEKVDQDLTETVGQVSGDLASFVQNQPPIELKWYNFLQYAVRLAILNGTPANIIVLILMFPLVASLIAFTRHIIGLKGFGVYAPAVLSVAFVSTGLPLGLVMFFFVIIVAVAIKKLTAKINLPYLPKTALLIWGICVAVLALILASGIWDWQFIIKISIFPLLIIILLSENFMESQLFSNQGTASRLTFETVLIAILGALLIDNRQMQEIVILHPEITLIFIATIDILIGRFTGLRWLERWRFKDIVQKG